MQTLRLLVAGVLAALTAAPITSTAAQSTRVHLSGIALPPNRSKATGATYLFSSDPAYQASPSDRAHLRILHADNIGAPTEFMVGADAISIARDRDDIVISGFRGVLHIRRHHNSLEISDIPSQTANAIATASRTARSRYVSFSRMNITQAYFIAEATRLILTETSTTARTNPLRTGAPRFLAQTAAPSYRGAARPIISVSLATYGTLPNELIPATRIRTITFDRTTAAEIGEDDVLAPDSTARRFGLPVNNFGKAVRK